MGPFSDPLIHPLSGADVLTDCRIPFTDPFRYTPHHLTVKASGLLISHIESSPGLSSAFADGKMLGVLIVEDRNGKTGYLSAFSGNAGGRNDLDGFVPPIYDLNNPEGHYRIKEAEISGINREILRLKEQNLAAAMKKLNDSLSSRDSEISIIRDKKSTLSRDSQDYISSSQFLNAEIKRMKDRWKSEINQIQEEAERIREKIHDLKTWRATMSDELQRWIFDRYIVHNAKGESASIMEIFQTKGLVPPGGTGECAAPKLLNYAFTHGMKPLAMGEFWYGESPSTAVRTQGHFYPSCTSKCGPLLGFMLRGMEILDHDRMQDIHRPDPSVIYEDDDIIVVSKPSGMPSVPGLDGRISLQEYLSRHFQDIFPIHRLDMDTSGIMVFGKTEGAASSLRKQFEEHSVKKTYIARLSPTDSHRHNRTGPELEAGSKGDIDLPLGPDYDERPRQKVDRTQGKPSYTGYEVIGKGSDGTTDILFYPHTGRTHQLRVHSAHIDGLGRPILGDLLYGGYPAAEMLRTECLPPLRLHLHALGITFTHPVTKEEISFTTRIHCW